MFLGHKLDPTGIKMWKCIDKNVFKRQTEYIVKLKPGATEAGQTNFKIQTQKPTTEER